MFGPHFVTQLPPFLFVFEAKCQQMTSDFLNSKLIPVQCNPIRAPRSCLLICWSPTKQEPFTRRNSLYIAFGSSFRSMYRLSTSLFQALRWWGRRKRVGKTRQRKARAAPPLPSFPPCFCSRFLNFRGSTVYAHHIFVVIGSLFLNVRLHSILNNREKKKSVKKRSRHRR